MRIVVTGSSGLIGRALSAALSSAGHEVTALVRRAAGPGEAHWDPARGSLDTGAFHGVDAVVHLAGAGIGDGRWSRARKDLILRSRVDATSLLARVVSDLDDPPSVLVSASAIGFYGDRGDEELTEDSPPGLGFQAEVCRAWEEATAPAEAAGVRVVHLRSAVVLARQGGALARQLPLFRAGLGGRLGRGDQWFSWITLRDEVGVILYVLADASLGGPLNASAPEPVTNRQFTHGLARALHRPAVMAVPRGALRIAFGREFADELLLGSARVLPARLTAAGYRFRDPTLSGALHEVLAH